LVALLTGECVVEGSPLSVASNVNIEDRCDSLLRGLGKSEKAPTDMEEDVAIDADLLDDLRKDGEELVALVEFLTGRSQQTAATA
jgi:hypothetical protein